MKKRERIKKEDNVILFPDLDKRLLEKGLDRLKQKKYREAIELLQSARYLDPDSEEVNVGLVLAYFESGNLTEANQLAKEMLQIGIGEYFKIVDMYIMILVQQHKHDEIVMTIEALLEEKQVPTDKLDHFMKLLQFSRKMADSAPESFENERQQQVENVELDLYSYTDPGEQVQIAGQLSHSNVRAYMTELTEFLSSEKGDPFFKTMLLNVLMEQDYEKEILVEKFARQVLCTPDQLFDVHEHPDLLAITDRVRDVVENENPILFESIKQLLDRYFFLLYPLRIEAGKPVVWAAAFHYTASAYFGQENDFDQIIDLYHVEETEVTTAADLIGKIEEILAHN